MTESVSPNGPECAHEIIPLPSGTPIMQRGRASMYKNGETSQGLLVISNSREPTLKPGICWERVEKEYSMRWKDAIAK